MPTILAFIIISSSMMLAQSIAIIDQLLGLKAEIDNIQLLEYAVNTKRVIEETGFEQTCRHTKQLEYDERFMIESNCLYLDKQVDLKQLPTTINKSYYQQVYEQSSELVSVVDGNHVIMNDTNFEYQQKVQIYFINYDSDYYKILIVDDNNQIIRNISVK